MTYLHTLVLLAFVGFAALSLNVPSHREANVGLSYLTTSQFGGVPSIQDVYLRNTGGCGLSQTPGSAQRGSMIVCASRRSSDTSTAPAGSDTQPPATRTETRTVSAGTQTSPSLIINTTDAIETSASPPQPSVGIADQLLQLLSGTGGNASPLASPFYASPLDRLWELVNLPDTASNPAVPNPSVSSSGSATANTSTSNVPPVSLGNPGTLTLTSTQSGNTGTYASQGLTGPETTFTSDAAMDEHAYIREVIGRMQQNRFVTNADYQVALVLAKDRVAESRALLDTRSSFQKFMDWIGIGSSLMIAYQQAEADLADLTYSAGLAGLGTQ